jgi:23S rRNA pseudouridine1911/1915/1917 synthase
MSDQLYLHHHLIVDKGQSPVRIDTYVSTHLENVSRTQVEKAAKSGFLIVNQKIVKSNYKVKPGDDIKIMMPEPKKEIKIIPENIPIDIVYEDDDLIVVNKAPGMVVHPAYGHYSGTLVNALASHLTDSELFRQNDIRPGLVHRIDKDTSGLLVIAKTEFAKNHLAQQFYEHSTKRRYIALVWGDFDDDEGTIRGNIGRNPKDRKVMYVFSDASQGKNAVTHYKVLERFTYVSLIECRLETGRTHQIRIHMKYIGHPLFNDADYGGDRILKGTTFSKYKQFVQNCFKVCPRQALHAKSLGFIHPRTQKEIYFESDLPNDMSELIEKWRSYIANREIEK